MINLIYKTNVLLLNKIVMGNYSNQKDINLEIKESDRLNIYVCGNSRETKKFCNKEIYNMENDIENHTDYFEGKSPNNNWYYNFYFNDLDEKMINKIIDRVIEEYKNRNNIYNNNIILIFFNSKENEKNQNLIKIILKIFENTSTIFKPILLFAFKENKKENEEEKENEEDEENRYNIFEEIRKNNNLNKDYIKRFIEIVYFKGDDYIEINKKISSLCCYFNNISDILLILDEIIRDYNFYHPKRNNKMKYNSTFNILLLGRPGSGKSTLINLLLNKKKARAGIGPSITKYQSRYIHDKYSISLTDTPGLENKNDLIKMINFLKLWETIFKKGKNKFHLVLYLINGSNERFFIDEEVILINHIQKIMNLPIFFVVTRSRNEEYAKDYEEVIKLNLCQNFGDKTNLLDNIYCCHLLNEKDETYKRFGIDKLIYGIKSYYEKEINKLEKNLVKKDDIEIIYSFEDIKKNNIPNSIFFDDLNNLENFEEYLSNISDEIIENYEYLSLKEIKKYKKDNLKNEIENKNGNINKINEMLIDHLAMELNGDSFGKNFCDKYRNEVEIKINNDNNNSSNSFFGCLEKIFKKKTLRIRDETINDEIIKKSIEMTKEFGLKAKNQFMRDLKIKGYNEYLHLIIESYKNTLKSLPLILEDIEK